MTEKKSSVGHVIWRELTTNDFAKSKAFYGELFGWVFDDMDMGGEFKYPVIKMGDKGIGGLMAPAMPGQPNAWLVYVSVDDVDASMKAAAANGGKVLAPAFDVKGVGRMGVLADFAGAVIAPMHPSSDDEPAATGRPDLGTFCWETLSTTDLDKAVAFYGAVMGWSTTTAMAAGEGKVFTAKDGTQIADLQKAPSGAPPMWLSYVVVEKLEPSRERAAKLGAKVLAPLIEVPKVGRIALIASPEGAVLGLFEPNMG